MDDFILDETQILSALGTLAIAKKAALGFAAGGIEDVLQDFDDGWAQLRRGRTMGIGKRIEPLSKRRHID
jgi:hypothetical protein